MNISSLSVLDMGIKLVALASSNSGLTAGNSRFLFHDLMRSEKVYGYLIVEGVRGLF